MQVRGGPRIPEGQTFHVKGERRVTELLDKVELADSLTSLGVGEARRLLLDVLAFEEEASNVVGLGQVILGDGRKHTRLGSFGQPRSEGLAASAVELQGIKTLAVPGLHIEELGEATAELPKLYTLSGVELGVVDADLDTLGFRYASSETIRARMMEYGVRTVVYVLSGGVGVGGHELTSLRHHEPIEVQSGIRLDGDDGIRRELIPSRVNSQTGLIREYRDVAELVGHIDRVVVDGQVVTAEGG